MSTVEIDRSICASNDEVECHLSNVPSASNARADKKGNEGGARHSPYEVEKGQNKICHFFLLCVPRTPAGDSRLNTM